MLDGKAFADQMFDLVQDYVQREIGRLAQRTSALEAKEPRDGRDGLPGMTGPQGRDGKDGADGLNASELEAPVDIAERISKAIGMICETPAISIAAAAQETKATNQPVSIHLPEIKMPELRFPEPVINVQIPGQAAPVVNVAPPPGRKMRTIVTKHDSKGRILEFEREEI